MTLCVLNVVRLARNC